MAKRKHPAALFEVIHTSPPPPLNIGRGRRSWWFAPRSSAARADVMRSLHPSMIPDEPHHPHSAATSTCSPEAELRARFAEPAELAHEVAVFSADEPEDLDMGETPTFHPTPASPTTVSYCAGGFRIDHGRQELMFRLSYTTAALAAFIGLVLLGLSFVVGKHLAERRSDDLAIQALRAGQPDPAVLNLDHNDGGGVTAPSADHVTDNSSAPQAQPHIAAAAPGDAGVPAGPAQRTIGLDYLVVQSYPTPKSAQDAADMLTQNGIPCTVEHGLRWAPNWYSVVTTAGYPPHSTEGDTLVDSIHKVAADQAKLGHRWRFEPQGYQWNQQQKSDE
jgi:hypothetical protein